ncbi:metallophosphoesterase [bacterium]|nr:metallophosphoesterase [bacterium]
MKIGILADTHDNISKTQKAVETLNKLYIPLIIHAGDIISPFTAKILSKLNGDFIAVFGNNDGDKIALKSTISTFGRIENPPMILEIANLTFCIMHDHTLINSISKKPSADIIIYGHLHEPKIITNNCLIINPGECCGYLSGKSTIAILDPETLDVEIKEI